MKITLALSLFLTGSAVAQQESLMHQFWNHPTRVNVAMTGLEYKHLGGLVYRHQWDGVENTPRDVFGYYATRIGESHGIGIAASSDMQAYAQKSMISAQYAYQFILNRKHTLSIGVAPTYASHASDIEFIPPQTLNDPSLPATGRSDHFLVHSGLAFASKRINFGVGIRNLNVVTPESGFVFSPHYYGHFTAKVNVGSKSSTSNDHALYIDLIAGTDKVLNVFQGNLRLELWQKLSLIGGYRTSNGLLFGVGWEAFKQFRATYSLQFTKSELSSQLLSTHEISLIYKLDFE